MHFCREKIHIKKNKIELKLCAEEWEKRTQTSLYLRPILHISVYLRLIKN